MNRQRHGAGKSTYMSVINGNELPEMLCRADSLFLDAKPRTMFVIDMASTRMNKMRSTALGIGGIILAGGGVGLVFW